MSENAIAIFSQRIDPERVLEVARRFDNGAKVLRDEQIWRQVRLQFRRGFFRKPLVLTVNHDPDYYSGPGWSRQHNGMLNYYDQFNMRDDVKDRVLRTIQNFRFCIGSTLEPELEDPIADPRMEVLCAIARELDGCLVTADQLLDASGNALFAADGTPNPKAVFPILPDRTEIDGEELGDGFDEPTPPSAQRVACRALVLAAVAGRGLMESQYLEGHEDVATHLPRIREWLEALNIVDECEAEEWRRIVTSAGDLPQQAIIDSTWRLEGLAVLAWALGWFPLPRYDTLIEPDGLLSAAGFLDLQRGQTLLGVPQLRPPEQLTELSQQMLAYHWRVRDFTMRPLPLDFQNFAANCWFGPISIAWAELAKGDLALQGFPVSEAPADVFSRCTSCAMERHQAINWLQGWSSVYSETDTST